MSDQSQRVWRAGPVALVLVSAFALAAGVIIPVLAYLIYRNGSALWLPALLVLLAAFLWMWLSFYGFREELADTNRSGRILAWITVLVSAAAAFLSAALMFI